MIYVVQSSIGGPVKIGYTAGKVERRLRELQCGSPFLLKVVNSFEGSTKDEYALHARFAHCRLHGEWFELTPEIIEWLRDLRGRYVYEPVERVSHPLSAMVDLPRHGPLSEAYSRVLAPLESGEWMRAGEIAAVAGLRPASVLGPLRSLRDSWRRLESRRVRRLDEPSHCEWRRADGLIEVASALTIAA